jgi:hypothetical protein
MKFAHYRQGLGLQTCYALPMNWLILPLKYINRYTSQVSFRWTRIHSHTIIQ